MKLSVKLFLVFPAFLLLLSCENQIQQESSIEEDVAMVNKKCPQMIDEETRLEKVIFTKPSLIAYNYSLVNLEKKNVDTTQFRLALWPGILSGIKVDKGLAGLREKKMNFEYRYFDRNKELIYTFKIGPANYQP